MSSSATDTKAEILATAEQLLRTRGYNGFSFGDVAEAVGTTRANIHYHYRTKEDLGRALIENTHKQLATLFDNCASSSTIEQLTLYFDVFAQSIRGDLVCLCGMLMAQEDALPPKVRDANSQLVEFQLKWLTNVLEDGRTSGEIHFDGSAANQANEILSSVQGSHIVARSRQNRDAFSTAMDSLLRRLKTTQ